jgi:hypothetical protein
MVRLWVLEMQMEMVLQMATEKLMALELQMVKLLASGA